MLKLLPHQPLAVDFLAKRSRALLADDTGLGKTIEAIAAIPNTAQTVIIVCPAIVRMVWVKELVACGFDIEDMRAPVKGSEVAFDRRFTILSYALARKVVFPKRIDHLILDESHNIKSFTSKTTEHLLPVIMRATTAHFLTATPVKNFFDELFTTVRHIVHPRILESQQLNNYYSFRARFCQLETETIYVRGGGQRTVTKIVGNKNASELLNLIQPNFLKRRKMEVLKDFPQLSWQPFYVNVKVDDEDERNKLALTIDPNTETLPAPIMALRIGSAMALVPTAIEIVQNHIEETNDPILVFCYHIDPIAAMAAQVPGSRTITGKTSQREREEIVRDYQAGHIPALFAQTIAAGVGLTLTRGKDVLFVDLPWNPADAIQARDRVHRIGQDRDVIARYLVNASDKISLRIAEIVSAKISSMEFG